MSRKNFPRKSGRYRAAHAAHVAHVKPALSMQEVEDRWRALHLQPRVKDHLENILRENGVELALAATTALVLEMQREEPKVAHSLWEWMMEELRLLLLEEGSQHIIDAGQLIVDALLTWTFVQSPVLLALVFLLIAAGVSLLSYCLMCVWRRRRASGR